MRIDRLILVTGPSCAGKTTFIEDLSAGRLPRIAEQLKLGDPSSWQCVLARDLPRLEGSQLAHVILHYDFLQRWSAGRAPVHTEDTALRALAAAVGEMTSVTLWAAPEVLHRRISERRSTFLRSLLSGRPWNSERMRGIRHVAAQKSLRRVLVAIGREINRLGAKRRLYRRPELFALYDDWLGFCSRSDPARQWLLDTTHGATELLPLSAWPGLKARAAGAAR
jgi:hypothetical protein